MSNFVRRVRSRLSVERTNSGFTIVELLVTVTVGAIVLLAISKFFVNYYISFRETQARLRLQRDMRTLTYWVRQDLTALAQRNNNFDLARGTQDFAFLAADDPADTVDWGSNPTDGGLDRFTYTFLGNKATRVLDRLGTMSAISKEFSLESIEISKGDTYSVQITLTDLNDSTLVRSNFDSTLANFDYGTPIRAVEVEFIFSKRPIGSIFGSRPPVIERGHLRSVVMYRRTG